MILVIGKHKVYKYKLEHDVPANWPHADEVLGYKDYSSIPEELWYCLNCGEHFSKTFDNSIRCLYEFKKFPRLYFKFRV